MPDSLFLDPAADRFSDVRDYLAAQLPGYNVWGQIHHGSQGVVFYAYQELSKRPVAVKVLLDGPLADDEQLSRFRREIEIISRLDHPNIVSLYECGVIVGRPYYTMAYIDGLPITEYALLHAPSVRQCVELFIQICDALGYAHQNGVIHRDLKPGNILIDHQGRPYLVDFGLAKPASSQDTFVTLAGRAVGTLQFLSPEQASEDDPACGDVRSDIYSLGVVMFQVLSGGLFPYPINGSPGQIRNHIIHSEPISLRAAVQHPESASELAPKDISRDLAAIVARTLAKEPGRRYRSAAELADDLRNYLDGRAVQARAGSTLYRLRKTLRAHRAALALVTMVFATVVSLWLKADSDHRAARTTLAANAALQVGSHLRLGSSARDAGREDAAAQLLKLSLQIAQSTPLQNDLVLEGQLFRTYYQLAEMYYLDSEPQMADPYCQVAVRTAERLLQQDSSSPEHLHNLGLARRLQAHQQMAKNEFVAAQGLLRSELDIRKPLLASDPTNEQLLAGSADAHALMGRCCRELKDYAGAWKHYMEAYHIRKALYESDPDSADYTLNLAMSEIKLAAWHMKQKSVQDTERAWQWLECAADRIRSHKQAGRLADHAKDTERVELAIHENLRILASRPINPS